MTFMIQSSVAGSGRRRTSQIGEFSIGARLYRPGKPVKSPESAGELAVTAYPNTQWLWTPQPARNGAGKDRLCHAYLLR